MYNCNDFMNKITSLFVACLVVSSLIIGQAAQAYIPNDPHIDEQSYLQRINAFAGWDYVLKHPSAKPIVVAVLDTGVDLTHPDISDSIWTNAREIPGNGIDDDNNSYIDDVHGWNFIDGNNDPEPTISPAFQGDAVSHGTIVAGIIGAGFDNGVGISGLAPKVLIMPIKALDSRGSGNTLVLSQAIDYAVDNGADVINLSLVGKVLDPRLTDAIARAHSRNIAVVAAAGNEEVYGNDLNSSPRYPVCDASGVNQVLGVASIDSDNVLSQFSNYGSQCVDISAPGTNIYSTTPIIPGNQQFTQLYSGGWTGTSVAAPMVSATIANIKRIAPKLTLDTIYNIIINNATNVQLANPSNPKALGGGLLNMGEALMVADRLQQQQSQLLAIASLGGKPEISLINRQGVVQSSFLAYAANFTGGVTVVTGDVDGDGQSDIVTAPYSNGGPHIRIFDASGHLKGQFMAFGGKWKTGFSLALGDVDGDGINEIIVVPNGGAASTVGVFDYKGQKKSEFLAYDQKFRGGSLLTVGDVDGDGVADIMTMPRQSGGPHVRVFDSKGTVKAQFMAFDTRSRGPFALTSGDIDHDGAQEIVAADMSTAKVNVRLFDGYGTQKNTWPLFPQLKPKSYKVAIVSGDTTGDGLTDLLFFSTDRSIQNIETYDYSGHLLNRLTAKLTNGRGWSISILNR